MGMRLAQMKKHFDKTSKVFRNLAPHVPEDVGCDEYADHCDWMSAKCDKAMEDEMNKLEPTNVRKVFTEVPAGVTPILRTGQKPIDTSGLDPEFVDIFGNNG